MAFTRAGGESSRSDPNSSHNTAASGSTSRRTTANKPRRNVPKTIFWAQSPNVLRCIPSVFIFGIDDPSLDGTLAVTLCRLFFFHPKVLGSAFLEADGVCMHSAKGKTYDNLLYADGLWGFLPGRRELHILLVVRSHWVLTRGPAISIGQPVHRCATRISRSFQIFDGGGTTNEMAILKHRSVSRELRNIEGLDKESSVQLEVLRHVDGCRFAPRPLKARWVLNKEVFGAGLSDKKARSWRITVKGSREVKAQKPGILTTERRWA
ncbi:hypothetical protein B0H19DRAFT_1086113 [Mycena capillaripes]|nr:hypothetical protein B0H19DRAFT_1086113 [Mycena capillaripes]